MPGWADNMLAQKAATLSLPPAAVISAEKAGLSSALPGLLPTWAVYAWQSPRSDGDGLDTGWVAGFSLAEGMAVALAAELAAAGVPVRFEGICPVAAARATPPPVTPTAARTALATSSFSCAHRWSPWLGSRTRKGSPEGHHGLSLTGEFAVVRRCGGRDR